MCLFCACLKSYCGCTIAQCVLCLELLYSVLAWPARVMYRFSRVCTCTVLVPLHSVYCACTPCTVIQHGSTGNVQIFSRLYLYCACTVTQCVLCLYPLYSDSAWQHGQCTYFARVCTRTVVVPFHSVFCACTSCTVFWHGQHGQCTDLTRVCTRTVCLPLHSVYCACTPCTRVCVCFLPIHSGHQVRWTYQPGSHRRKVTQDFPSTFLLRCVPFFPYLSLVDREVKFCVLTIQSFSARWAFFFLF